MTDLRKEDTVAIPSISYPRLRPISGFAGPTTVRQADGSGFITLPHTSLSRMHHGVWLWCYARMPFRKTSNLCLSMIFNLHRPPSMLYLRIIRVGHHSIRRRSMYWSPTRTMTLVRVGLWFSWIQDLSSFTIHCPLHRIGWEGIVIFHYTFILGLPSLDGR